MNKRTFNDNRRQVPCLVVNPMDRSIRIPRDSIAGLSIVTILYRDGRKAGRLVY